MSEENTREPRSCACHGDRLCEACVRGLRYALASERRAREEAERKEYFAMVEKELAGARIELGSIIEAVRRMERTTTDKATANELAHYGTWNTHGSTHGIELLEGYRAAESRSARLAALLREERAAVEFCLAHQEDGEGDRLLANIDAELKEAGHA